MPFLPDGVDPPYGIETDRFRIHPLGMDDTLRDYDAVMTSVDYLKDRYFNAPGWPTHDLSFFQDLIDLTWHYKERQLRRSFAFAVVNPDESVQVGCLYVDPLSKEGFDAEVSMWVRASEKDTGLDEELYASVRKWIEDEWPFEKVAYPGREYTREQWDSLP